MRESWALLEVLVVLYRRAGGRGAVAGVDRPRGGRGRGPDVLLRLLVGARGVDVVGLLPFPVGVGHGPAPGAPGARRVLGRGRVRRVLLLHGALLRGRRARRPQRVRHRLARVLGLVVARPGLAAAARAGN